MAAAFGMLSAPGRFFKGFTEVPNALAAFGASWQNENGKTPKGQSGRASGHGESAIRLSETGRCPVHFPQSPQEAAKIVTISKVIV